MTSPAESSAGPVRVERLEGVRAGVVVLTLDLPERRNAMTAELTTAWQAAISALKADGDARCVVVAGAGPAFCSGGDVGWIGAGADASVAALRARMMPFYRAWLGIRELEVPTIAAVQGPAIGAGLCLALACDLRYATPEARFSAPFTSLGMHAGMAATWLLPEAVGVPAARELLFTGRVVLGDEAADLGLVNRVLPADGFHEAVLNIAADIAATAPVATRLTKVALARGGHADFDTALQWEGLAQPITLATADLQEGLAAAKERRKPNFTGH
jgi:enoyl-CoA hydratase